MDSEDYEKSEWNSNKEVIKRMNETIVKINAAKHDGNTEAAIDFMRDYYFDMCGSLTPQEDTVWQEIKNLKMICNPVGEGVGGVTLNKGAVLHRLDEVDRTLRRLAKKHGLHMSDKEDLSGL